MFSRKKNTMMAISILLLCNVANAKYSEVIEIHGKLENFKERVIQIVFRWKSDGKYYKDSCTVKHSKYIFKTKISEPTRFLLQAKYLSKTDNPYFKIVDERHEGIMYFLEPKKITLISIDSFTNTSCKGSETNTVFEIYDKGIKSYADIDCEANKIFHSSTIYTAHSLDIIEKIKDSLRLSDDVKSYKKYAKTVLGPLLLNTMYDQGYNTYVLKELYNLLSEECKLTRSAQILLKNLNSYTPLSMGQSFEWFTMADTSRKPIDIAKSDHKIILVDLWASWCAPCRQQMPELKQIYNDFHDKGFEVVAVSLDDKLAKWKKAIIDDKLPWVNVSDLNGWNNELVIKYYVQSIPYNILIDNNGKIIATEVSMYDLKTKCKDLIPNP
jgi:thiol-disulfide isomerase/thioredoxin